MKPVFEDTHCPRCGNSDETESDEAVQMVMPVPNEALDRTRVVWCAAGHITVINGKGKVTEVNDWDTR